MHLFLTAIFKSINSRTSLYLLMVEFVVSVVDFKCWSIIDHLRYINIDCVSESLCKSFVGGPSYGNYQSVV